MKHILKSGLIIASITLPFSLLMAETIVTPEGEKEQLSCQFIVESIDILEKQTKRELAELENIISLLSDDQPDGFKKAEAKEKIKEILSESNTRRSNDEYRKLWEKTSSAIDKTCTTDQEKNKLRFKKTIENNMQYNNLLREQEHAQ